jgi:hypothetical protein
METAMHPTAVVVSAAPAEVPVGRDVSVTVGVACSSRCDLRGQRVSILGPDGVVVLRDLVTFVDGVNETSDVTLTVPDDVGEYTWHFGLPQVELSGCSHQHDGVPISLRAVPHGASLAVWDVPPVVAIGHAFDVKVGVRCSVGCQLANSAVDIVDANGAQAGEGRLSSAPLAGTAFLHWTTVRLRAPEEEGVHFWTAGLADARSGLAHEAIRAGFSARVSRPAEHTVTIAVTAGDSTLPLGDAEVRVGPYQAVTDERGIATIAVPSGTYGIGIRREGYAASPLTLDVRENFAVAVPALVVPTKAVTEQPVGPLHPYRD